MKLFCHDEMQRLEMAAVSAGVTLAQLMENAGKAVAQEVECRCRPLGKKRAVVLCGKGNNGGDGFFCLCPLFCGAGCDLRRDSHPGRAENGPGPGSLCLASPTGGSAFRKRGKRGL